MGHSVQLDEVYYDKGSDKSLAKLLEEYSKAIDALTINEENRLRKKVEELTPKSDEIQAMRVVTERMKHSEQLSLVVDGLTAKLNNTQKLVDYGRMLSERIATKLNITERPTETELEEYTKRVLKKMTVEGTMEK
jgi:hypothetical protein